MKRMRVRFDRTFSYNAGIGYIDGYVTINNEPHAIVLIMNQSRDINYIQTIPLHRLQPDMHELELME